MCRRRRIVAILLVGLGLGIGCAPAGSQGAAGAPGSPASNSGAPVKRITLATANEQDIRPTAQTNGMRVILPLLHSGLTVLGEQRVRHPLLAEAVPSLDNGLWKIFPDGRMETTWRLREGVRWHDGAPLTADDLLFSLHVGRDREMSAFNVQGYTSIDEARALDPRTLTIAWKEPFIEADAVLENRPLTLLPRHILEDTYGKEKASFLDIPYWTSEFVGAGPFRVREWIPGVQILFDANSEYVLGRPKVDRIEWKFIPDANTLTANILAGTVDVAFNVGSIDLGIQLRDQWRGGTMAFNYGSDAWIVLLPQFVDPRPSAVADLQVRRALAHAIDRQEMVDTLVAGMSPVPHSFMSPNQAAYREIEAALPRYDYDPRQATQLLEDRGYRKGADGIYRGEANRRLVLEVRSTPTEQAFKPASAVADYWQRLGVDATAVRLTPQQNEDLEHVATFPAFFVTTAPNDTSGLRSLHSSQTRLPSNNFRAAGAGNRSRYMNPEFDALLETYFKTVPVAERIQLVGRIIRQMAEQVTLVGIYYNPQPGAISDRLVNVSREWPGTYITWNAHEWDARN